jgi:hypothetical protein
MMNAPQWHLALNHIPVLGAVFGLVLFVFGTVRKSRELSLAALWTWAVISVFGIPVYLTGEPSEMVLMEWPGNLEDAIEHHEGAAQFAFTALLILGAGSIATLIYWRNTRVLPGWCLAGLLLLGLIVSGLMGWTANLGGHIRHPEVIFSAPPEEKSPP